MKREDKTMDLKGRNFLTLKDYTPEEILYLHHFGTALRGGKGSCRADFSTGRLRHSRHSALPSRTWWNVFLIGNAKISGHPPLPRSYIFPLFLQILLPGRKCVIWR